MYWICFGVFASTQDSYSSWVASSAVKPSSSTGAKSVNPTICQSFMIFCIFDY
nr:MAG TPA: hypothetical protein [Caudoviricetes sp.]